MTPEEREEFILAPSSVRKNKSWGGVIKAYVIGEGLTDWCQVWQDGGVWGNICT